MTRASILLRSPTVRGLLAERDRVLDRLSRAPRAQPDVSARLERGLALYGAVSTSHPELTRVAARIASAMRERIGGFVIPSPIGNRLVVAIDAEAVSALDELLTEATGARPEWWHDPSGARQPRLGGGPYVTERGSRLRAVVRGPLPVPFEVVAHCYVRRDGTRYCHAAEGAVPRTLHVDLPPPGSTMATLADLLGAGAPDEVGFPIDVVYTWVNDRDPGWRAMYDRAAAGRPDANGTEGTSAARYADRDELRHSLRSIDRNMPWVRNVFVLTNCAPPSWFAGRDDVIWVDHREVMDERHLPTFNSHAIECWLHRIPGLAEHFVYFNDDMLANRPVAKTRFFGGNGASFANLEPYGAVNGEPKAGAPGYLNAARNGAALMREAFGISPTQLHRHSPYALRRSVIEEMERRWPDAFERTRAATFRSRTDLSIPSFLYHHFAQRTGRGEDRPYESALVKPTSPRLARTMRRLRAENSRFETVCLNDGRGSVDNPAWEAVVRGFLRERFPTPTTAEAEGGS